MAKQSLAASAKQYAKFWATSERSFVSGLAARDRDSRLRALQKAAPYFRIARNFPLKHDTGRGLDRLAPVLDILDRYRGTPLQEDTFVQVVGNVRRELADAYGKADLLSAATKLLWLVHRHPVVIFDSNVRNALNAPGTDYHLYLSHWNDRWRNEEAEINRITSAMPKQIGVPTTEEWFRRRVLDIHLWNEGAPE